LPETSGPTRRSSNFTAEKIVSAEGFASLGKQLTHQSRWKKSVFEVYRGASIPHEWTPILKEECDRSGIEYFSTPYDFEALDILDPYVKVYKIGSGDITWAEMIERVARKGKPVLLATGASDIAEVQRAVQRILPLNRDLVLMQCNTNYTGSVENFKYIQLNVLRTFAAMYPGMLLGLSDHTPGHATVLGAVTLGARVIEKHFTDDTSREGPDHPFSMDPRTWREMVDRTRELESALGDGNKLVEENERSTVVVQRRCLRAARDLAGGTTINRDVIDVLRPAPQDAIGAWEIDRVIGLTTRRALAKGESLTWQDVGD